MVSNDRSPDLTNPYRSWVAGAAGCEPGSLRSSQARALLAGGVAAGLTTAGMLLGAGGALADDVPDTSDTSTRSSSSTADGSKSSDTDGSDPVLAGDGGTAGDERADRGEDPPRRDGAAADGAGGEKNEKKKAADTGGADKGTPPTPPASPPLVDTPQRQWTETEPDAALVNVTAGPTGTTAVTDRADGGQESRRYNPDGSYTSTVTYLDGKQVGTTIDEAGVQTRKVYRDGELVRESTSIATPRTPPPTLTPEQVAQASSTVYVTGNGERAVQNTLVDSSVTAASVTGSGVDVRRTVAENGAGLTSRDNGGTTTYRQVRPDGRTVVRIVNNETGEIERTRRFQGEVPTPIVLPTHAQNDPTPLVTASTTATGQPMLTRKWSDGTVLGESTNAGGDTLIGSLLPSGTTTTRRRDVNGDVVTAQAGPTGPVGLSTRDTTGVGVRQDLHSALAELPISAVEVGEERGKFRDVQVTGGGAAPEVVSFGWGRNDVEVTTDGEGRVSWNQTADEDLRATLNPEPVPGTAAVEPVDWDTWSIRRDVDGGVLTRRAEQRIGDDGEVGADGLFELADNGDTRSSWEVRDRDGRRLTVMDVGVDGSVRRLDELDPDLGPDYRGVHTRDGDGTVSSVLRWDESDIGNGVTEVRTRRLVDGDGFVRYGRQGADEDAMRVVFTDATGRFADGRPTLTAQERALAQQHGFVIADASAVERGEGRRNGDDALIVLPAWATAGELAAPPAGGYANGTGPDSSGVAAAVAGPPAAAYSTVAKWLAGRVGQEFELDGLAQAALVNAVGAGVGLIAGDEGALRNAGAALAGAAVDDVLRDALPAGLGFAGGAAGNAVATVIAGGDVDPTGIISSAGQEIVTNVAGTAAGYAGGGALRLAGKAVFGGGLTATDVIDETIATGAGVACSAAGTPVLGAACYGVARFVTGLFGSKPDDLAENVSEDHEENSTRTDNPLAGPVDDARGGAHADDELWTAGYSENLAADMEFAPDRAGTLTRQAHLATTAPNRTLAPEAQRREDFGKLAEVLAAGTPEMRGFADYMLASAAYSQRSAGEDDRWHQRNFDRAASVLGLAGAFGVEPVGPGRMTEAQARAIVDASGARLGHQVVDPLSDGDLDLEELPSLDQLALARQAEATDGYESDTVADGDAVTARPQRYAGSWWQDFYRAQRLADSRDVADVVGNDFGDRSADDIEDMPDQEVYEKYLYPSYIGRDVEGDPARAAYTARRDATRTVIGLIREHGGVDGPRGAASLLGDAVAGGTSPAYLAPKTAPPLAGGGLGDVIGGIVTSFADAVQSLDPARPAAPVAPTRDDVDSLLPAAGPALIEPAAG